MEPIIFKDYLECQCSSKEHLAVLEYDSDLGLMLSLQAYQWRGFFKRCIQALKYVFGQSQGELCWDTCMIKPEDLPKIKQWLQMAEDHGLGEDYGVFKK